MLCIEHVWDYEDRSRHSVVVQMHLKEGSSRKWVQEKVNENERREVDRIDAVEEEKKKVSGAGVEVKEAEGGVDEAMARLACRTDLESGSFLDNNRFFVFFFSLLPLVWLQKEKAEEIINFLLPLALGLGHSASMR